MKASLCLTDHPLFRTGNAKEPAFSINKPRFILKYLFSALLLFLLMANAAKSQYDTVPCPNCTADDIKIIEFLLKGYNPGACPDSGVAITPQKLTIKLDVTAKQRYGFLFVGNLYINNVYHSIVSKCYEQTFDQGPREVELSLPSGVTITAGTKFEFRNILTAWDNNKPKNGVYNVCNGYDKTSNTFYCKAFAGTGLTPKCKYYESFIVIAPAKPVITEVSKVNVSCNGGADGAISISVSPNSQSPYVYAWTKTGGGFSASTQNVSGLSVGEYTVTVSYNGCSNTKNFTITEPTALTATTSSTDALCNGATNGTATVTPSGGTGPYSYSWNTTPIQTTATATGLSAGTYTCTITDDNGCTLIKNVTVSQPSTLNAYISAQTNVLCNEGSTGSATVAATGGTSPYSYSWNTTPVQSTATATGLEAGSYIATVTDDNGCTDTSNVTITEPSVISVSATAAEFTICEGSTTTITVTASGGVSPYQYKLDDGSYQSGNTFTAGAGGHTVTVKDANHCTKTDDITINDKECNIFCTYTQGYFGTDNPGKASYDQGDGCTQTVTRITIQNSLDWWDDNGGMHIGNIGPNKFTVESILGYLPGGGPSVTYGDTVLTGAPSNTLLAQTLTLGLNIGLNEYLAGYIFNGDIIAQKTDGICGQGNLIAGSCDSYPLPAEFQNKTVQEIFEAAGDALVSGTADRRNTLAGIAGAINELFDACAKTVPGCSDLLTSGSSSNSAMNEQLAPTSPYKLEVKAYPNPFRNIVHLRFRSPVEGDALIELYDVTGRKLEARQLRNVQPGYDNLIEFNAQKHSYSLLYYKIQIGRYSETGKLVNARK